MAVFSISAPNEVSVVVEFPNGVRVRCMIEVQEAELYHLYHHDFRPEIEATIYPVKEDAWAWFFHEDIRDLLKKQGMGQGTDGTTQANTDESTKERS